MALLPASKVEFCWGYSGSTIVGLGAGYIVVLIAALVMLALLLIVRHA